MFFALKHPNGLYLPKTSHIVADGQNFTTNSVQRSSSGDAIMNMIEEKKVHVEM